MKRAAFVLICSVALVSVSASATFGQVPLSVLLRITQAEDERRWDDDLRALLTNRNAAIRKRAALAAGRIGNEDSVLALSNLMKLDTDASVRAMAAFALGEVESPSAAEVLIAVIKNNDERGELRARALEALGKIAGALPQEQQARQRELGAVICEALEVESTRSANQLTVLLGITAVLRSRPADAGATLAKFLNFPDARVRSDAANALARLRLKDGNERLRFLVDTDRDPNVRANTARVLGVTEDKDSFQLLLSRATSDTDERVRVSGIRALAALKNPNAADLLLKHITTNRNEILEIATTVGRLIPETNYNDAIFWFKSKNETLNHTAPEIEIAFARVAPEAYLADLEKLSAPTDWRAVAAIANALAEFPALPELKKSKPELITAAEARLRKMLVYHNVDNALPDVLRALAAFKTRDLQQVLVNHLQHVDVIVRATAADLLGDLPPSADNTRALISAWPGTTGDSLNDAALSILDGLGKQKNATANEAIKIALRSNDYIVRQRAATILKANGAGDFFSQVWPVKTRNTQADYRRALARMGRKVQAVVTTTKGSFTMELLPSDAPLTVDNFVQLAQRNYYRGITIHRVVPNFVIQDGDPRGDGNGGPGYQIRCEINQVPYDRATVGMALSGKDTGGSQWFVTHAPQPHLDGGYTVFGRVVRGMEVVDRIERGDVVKSITIQ